MDKKIKICFIVAVDITVKLILLNYLKRLDKNRYEIWVVCSPSPYLHSIERDGIKIKEIRIARSIFSPIADVISLFHLAFFLRKEKFDIVQVQTPKAAFLGQLAAHFARIPIVINNNFGFYFENFGPVKKRLFVFLEKFASRYADLMFTINKQDIQTAIENKIIASEKIKYLGFGIDIKRFDPSKFSEKFISQKKKEIGIESGKKVIGIIARLVEEKGYLDLFEAFRGVIKKNPEILLLIVGIEEPRKKDAIDISTIKDYGIENNVIFLGQRDDIEEIYPVMDIFVLPTHREGLGNTILEASAMKKPVIATDIRGCRESVDNGATGLLVPPKNPKELQSAILSLLNNPLLCSKFGEAGRVKIKKNFNEDNIFRIIVEEYRKLIKKKECKYI